MLATDGSLDRKKLGSVVFADPAARADLEAITHPLIAMRGAEKIAANASAMPPSSHCSAERDKLVVG